MHRRHLGQNDTALRGLGRRRGIGRLGLEPQVLTHLR